MTTNAEFEGLTANQKEIVDYWQEQRRANGVVTRSDIDPGRLRAHLSRVSLLDVTTQDPVFRIVGSRLRDLLGMDARGRSLSDLPESAAKTWTEGLETACQRGTPFFGFTLRGKVVHAWLRAPLFCSAGRVAQVLCHDELLTEKELRRDRQKSVTIPRSEAAFAA